MGRSKNRLADALDEETVAYIQERLQERLELKNDRQYDAADEIREELRERFGVAIDDRMQEWVVEVDQFSVVNNVQRYRDDERTERPQPPPSYSVETDDSDDIEVNGKYAEVNNNADDLSIDDTNGLSLERLTIPELKERLRAAGLPVSGKKSELIARITEALM
jgi:SAP domain